MGLLSFLFRTPQAQAEPVREAAGKSVEPDDDSGWRRISGDAKRDLNPMDQTRMQEVAVYLWKYNPLARQLIELPLVYLLAEGVRLAVQDEEAQSWLKAFWSDPINAMDLKLPKYVREASLFGEICLPVFRHDITGEVRLGYIDPGLIEAVRTDPDNATQPIGVVVRNADGTEKRHYRVIVLGPETVFSAATQALRETFSDGECFYFPFNDLATAARGLSDLLTQADWLDGYDKALWGEMERWDFLRAFIWDVELAGATPDEIAKRAKEIVVPTAGGVRVHNDSEKWSAVGPDLKTADGSSNARLFRNHVMGGAMLPEHWFGGGGDVNRSTGESMGEPTFKTFSFRQRTWKYILESIARYVILSRARAAGVEAMADEPEYQPEAIFPELTTRDTTAYAAALQQVVVAVGLAIDRKLMTVATGLALIAAIAGRLGVEIDPAAELAAVAEQAKRQVEEDMFRDEPDEEAEP